ncbi:MAG: tetratricopeptide repeat protein [Gemmatimonadaceae bacterium]
MRALALDSTLAEGHWALGQILFGFDFDWPAAGREFDRAIELDSRSIEARNLRAIYLLGQSRFEEAESELMLALATDPLVSEISQTLGRVYLYTRQTDKAIRYLHEALALAPDFSYARGNLAHALLQRGMLAEAVTEFERAAASGGPGDAAQVAYVYAICDRRSDATTILDGLLAPGHYAPPYHTAMAYVGLGETDTAFQWQERAYAERDPHIGSLNVMPAFDSLRSDLRFGNLVRRMGLVP